MSLALFKHAAGCMAVMSAFTFALPAWADDAQDVSKMVKAGQYDQALQRADAFLANKPKDAQMRFLKGLILTEQGKTTDAIGVFMRLTEDYPELPEPYNNLAVLFASQGQYDKARAALEMAIRTHPSYATAHENLGDIYAKLASQAYDKALQLDSNNTAAQTKLSLIRDLIGNGARKPTLASPAGALAAKPAAPAPVMVAAAPAVAPKPVEAPKAAPAPVAAPVAKPVAAAPAPAPVVKPAAAPAPVAAPPVAPPVAAPAPVAAKPVEAPKPEAAHSGEEADVQAAIQAWARAWSGKEISAYLSAYAKNFEPPKGQTRAQWEADRRARISGKAKISVTLEEFKASVDGNSATARFRQIYKSDRLSTTSHKQLILEKSNGKWLIKQERAGA